MTDTRKILRGILATRLESLTDDDLSALQGLPTTELVHLYALALDAGGASAPPAAPPARPNISLKEALVEVMRSSEKPLTSNEIVARVTVLRPGSEEPSIRSEISRARKLGVIVLRGDPRGGTYTPAASVARAPSRASRAST